MACFLLIYTEAKVDVTQDRGRNRLPKLVQTIATSVPFTVFKSEGEPGEVFIISHIIPVNCLMDHISQSKQS